MNEKTRPKGLREWVEYLAREGWDSIADGLRQSVYRHEQEAVEAALAEVEARIANAGEGVSKEECAEIITAYREEVSSGNRVQVP